MLPNVVLFDGEDSSGRYELWETNGTAAGTIELTGIGGIFANGLGPVALVPYTADEVLFGGAGANGLYGLWETNGTAAGTNELTGIAGADTTGAGLYPSNFTIYNGEVLFTGYDSSGELGLWVTNGTGTGTHELAVAGASTTSQNLLLAGLNPSDLTVYNGYVFFSGDDASGRVGLWETNGTAAGTYELSVAGAATVGQNLGAPGLYPSDFTVFNDQMLFSGNDARSQTGLWETDGTAAGTHELTGIAGAATTGVGLDPSDLTVYNGEVLFSGIDSSGLYGLWVTNGTAAGTHELAGIAGEATTGPGLYPQNLTNLNGEILFAGRDSSGLCELWVTNGTAAGTHELTGIAGAQTSGVGLDPSYFAVYNGEVLFTGYDASGKLGLWVTNGTGAGTHELTGVTGAAGTGLAPSDLTAIGGSVLTAGASVKYVAGGAPVTLDAGLSISDSESTSLIGAAVSIGAGFLAGDALSVGSPQTGIASSYNAATGVLTLSGTASLAAYQTELDSVTFASPGATSPSRTITWSVNDGVTTSTPASSSVSVSSVPPVLTAGASVKYVAGGAPVTLDAGLSISDSESTSLIGAAVSIGAGFLAGDALSVGSPQTGIASSYNAATGVLTLSGTASLAAYQTELDSVTFASPSATSPSRTITWSVNDGVTTSTPASSSVSVSSVPPVLAAGASVKYVAGGAPVTLDAGLSIGDSESTSLIGAAVSIGAGFLAGDALSVGSPQTGIASSYNAATGVLTLSGTASLAAYQTELDSVTFASPGATSPSRTITWSVNDGVTTSTPASSSVSVSSVPPVLAAGASVKYVAGGAPVTLDAGLSIGDSESTSLIGAAVSIGAGFLAGDALSVGSPQTGIASSYNAATGVLTLSGTASLAAYQTELDSVTFASPGATSPSRTITWSVNDGVTTSTPASSSLLVSSVDPSTTTALSPPNFFSSVAEAGILWQNSDGDVELWNPNGSGGFTYDNIGAVNSSWQIAGTGDFNGSGEASILWRNANGDTELWNSNGSGGFTYEDLGSVNSSWQIAGTGDFNGSGEASILWRNANGDTELWNSNGSGGFTFEDLGVVNTSWQIAGTGDFNGSGEAGILWRNTNGNVEIWNSNGSGGFTYDNLGSVNSSWQIAGTGDFNGDGADDILWRNSTNGDVELWNSNGSGGFTYDNLGAINSSWQIAGTGDFTGTGQDSILWRNAAGDTELWNPNGVGGFTYDDLGGVSTSWSIHKIFA